MISAVEKTRSGVRSEVELDFSDVMACLSFSGRMSTASGISGVLNMGDMDGPEVCDVVSASDMGFSLCLPVMVGVEKIGEGNLEAGVVESDITSEPGVSDLASAAKVLMWVIVRKRQVYKRSRWKVDSDDEGLCASGAARNRVEKCRPTEAFILYLSFFPILDIAALSTCANDIARFKFPHHKPHPIAPTKPAISERIISGLYSSE